MPSLQVSILENGPGARLLRLVIALPHGAAILENVTVSHAEACFDPPELRVCWFERHGEQEWLVVAELPTDHVCAITVSACYCVGAEVFFIWSPDTPLASMPLTGVPQTSTPPVPLPG